MKWMPLIAILFIVPLTSVSAETVQSHYQVDRPMELQQRLQAAYLAKGVLYKPRTEHLKPDGSPVYINRLILQDSPYLLQHAHNPVDWHPWGQEAFDKAKRENKPIFLSIGYSTCHWCHVMERESFENPDIAKYINEHFIAIKVDRETHPSVDEIYMTAVTLMTGHGGWPMSSFLTSEGKPFYGGTYYPPEQFYGVLQGVIDAWRQRLDDVRQQADDISEAVNRVNSARGTAKAVDDKVISKAVVRMVSRFDELQGGFSEAPKFPHEPWLFLLLNHAERHRDKQALEALEVTLDAMARGGIYDQAGGGFHRYSIDNEWLVPHFEKMLYNQAHLARVYLHAWRITGKEQYRRVAVQTLDYVQREMTGPGGGFYSATDADSEGEEGAFFVWSVDEIRHTLSKADADLAIKLYSVIRGGNFEGKNILHLAQPLEDSAKQLNMDIGTLRNRIDSINKQLWRKREQREHPLRDDKVVTAWNGMMISAFAQAAKLLDSKPYATTAEQAATFLWNNNLKEKGQLWRVHLNGRSSINAALEDYSYLTEGLIHLYDLNEDKKWLQRAIELADAADRHFSDDNGAFYLNSANNKLNPMGRPRDGAGDNATPSGTSVMLRVLQMLTERTGEHRFTTRANRLIAAHAGNISDAPSGYGYLLTGLDDLRNGELNAHGYAARGGISLKGAVRKLGDNKFGLSIELDIPGGWHINADKPLSDNLIPTAVSLGKIPDWSIDSIQYPKAVKQQLDFQPEPLLVYEGRVKINAIIKGDPDKLAIRTLPVDLQLQACSNKICLPPETQRLMPALHK